MMKKSDNVSRVLLTSRVEAASVRPNANTISVFDGRSYVYIPNTLANQKKLDERLGKSKTQFYRGEKRKVWLDSDVY